EMAKVLNLLPDELDEEFPIQEVSTGNPFIMVPIKTLDSVQRAEVNLPLFKKLLSQSDPILSANALFVFCPEALSSENHIHARAFVHLHGIPEDPATGSANGCFAGWMSQYQYFGSHMVDVRVEQGYEINRPSLLFLKAEPKDEAISVQVGGRVQLVARGDLL
ncbi:MAG: PhzF family phenazine biosynthesis isomerase, partial [Chloroflexota bacterium]